MSQRVRKVVIPVAGLGTRSLPYTKVAPKELLPIIDTPTIHFIVEEALRAGIEQVIFVTSSGKSALEDYFDLSPALDSWLRKRGKEGLAEKMDRVGRMVEVTAIRQKEPLGLGHAIACAEPVVGNEAFAVCLGDEIFPPWDGEQQSKTHSPLPKLVANANEKQASVVGVVRIEPRDSKSYGIVDLGGADLSAGPAKVLRAVEKPAPEKAPSQFAIIGRYVFQARLFEHLRNLKPGVGGELQLTDAMNELAKEEGLYASEITHRRYDIGNAFGYVKAVVDAGLRRDDVEGPLREYLKSL